MVDFFAEACDLPDIETDALSQFIQKVSKEAGHNIEQLNYIFCSDEFLLNINMQYLDHDYYTDILTFPLQENPLIADIFISLDRVNENAEEFNTSLSKELHRVIFHGILHLIGYNDKTDAEEAKMRTKEDDCLKEYGL